jgi:hypothetical protein
MDDVKYDRMGDRNVYRIFVGKHFETLLLVTPRRRWKMNIKMNHRVVRFEDGRWMKLAQDCAQF